MVSNLGEAWVYKSEFIKNVSLISLSSPCSTVVYICATTLQNVQIRSPCADGDYYTECKAKKSSLLCPSHPM